MMNNISLEDKLEKTIKRYAKNKDTIETLAKQADVLYEREREFDNTTLTTFFYNTGNLARFVLLFIEERENQEDKLNRIKLDV